MISPSSNGTHNHSHSQTLSHTHNLTRTHSHSHSHSHTHNLTRTYSLSLLLTHLLSLATHNHLQNTQLVDPVPGCAERKPPLLWSRPTTTRSQRGKKRTAMRRVTERRRVRLRLTRPARVRPRARTEEEVVVVIERRISKPAKARCPRRMRPKMR